MNGIMVLIAYTIIMIGATLLLTKRENSIDGFHVGNRCMGTIESALSIAATWIWAPALFTSAEKAYTDGFVGLFWFLVPNVLCLILFIPFAKRIRKAMPEGITLSGFMGERYQSKAVKNTYLFQLASLSILSTAVQLLAGSKILSLITGIDYWMMTIILAVIAFSYSQFSGIKASIKTDAVQMIFMLITCSGLVIWALASDNGTIDMFNGFGGITGEYSSLFSHQGLQVFLGFGLPTAISLISGPFGDQSFWQRTFAVKANRIGRSFAIGAALFGLVPLSMGILGFIGAGTGFIPADTGVINFELIAYLFPAWVIVPFIFLVVSGLLSTVDSNLCATASLTTDLSQRQRDNVKLSKFTMLLLLLTAIAVANIKGLTVTHMFLFYGTLRASTLLPTVLTLLNIKLSATGVTTGIVTALCLGLPILTYGTLTGVAIYKTVGSLVTVLTSGIIALSITKTRREAVWRKS